MKIYFAGSIRGGRDDRELYMSLITALQEHGTVLTEHIGNKALTSFGEVERTDRDIYERDMEWVREADVVVAEVTTPSLGVGYEIGQAEALGKPILCLFRETEGKRLSAMLSGNLYPTCVTYLNLEDATQIIGDFLSSLSR